MKMLKAVPTQSLNDLSYDTLNVRYDESYKTLTFAMDPGAIPCFSYQLLRDINRFQTNMADYLGGREPKTDIDFLVFASDVPGVFNLGGDLKFFVDMITSGDRRTLQNYAELSIDVLYANFINLNADVRTISLVTGTALGAGFEAALSSDYIIAEAGATFKFPEVVFNMFPGMGAYSFLARRISPALVEKMIVNAEGYSAEALYEMGIVDAIADPGQGEVALRSFIRRLNKSNITRRSVLRMRNRVLPLEKQELLDIAHDWVEAAFSLSERDISAMSRLVRAQSKMMSQSSPSEKQTQLPMQNHA
ncbi:MAG: enoyl-CoA hydratase/isomerase family protein [Candidatus Thiodiazotropha sp. (ex Dulcina madagascariensis)]|nr:enoyl-CoA hydratase/isomerase family protein [Candidatus Thiodiazotropha sp. (ex Epidulcina cf. delphinae)]MCU7921704.1 enoyl-CoA hydratase/isomerase family protein [Candidatus Thiodiazotropha sp. (ex Dulcina madagascariensis)]MCU7926057.1 enoyl-CoA hydratase/isomerase family protein [Candidatus Thiodiazotropha sp. (ex Dulcina madagascariensis)]